MILNSWLEVPSVLNRLGSTVRWAGWALVGSVVFGGGNGQAFDSESPWFGVLRSGQPAALRAALEQGASVNTRDAAGNTPLMWAAQYADLDAMRVLVERGADVNATNSRGATALMRASYDARKVSWLLNQGADVRIRSGFGNTALILAARTADSYRSIKALVDAGAEVDVTNVFGVTPLIAASAGGDPDTVRLLLRRGANPNAQPVPSEAGFLFGGGRSPLMWAAYRDNLPVMKSLLHAGADVDAEGGLGTSLMQAAWGDHPRAARLLLQRGAEAKLAGRRDGYTALHWAASTEQQDPSLVTLLLNHGASPEIGGGAQIDAFMEVLQTPLMLARKRGDTPILAALSARSETSAGPSVKSPEPVRVRTVSDRPGAALIEDALQKAVKLLQQTSLESKQAFLRHASKQDCTSCHQQYLPMAAIGLAKRGSVQVDSDQERQLIAMVAQGEFKDFELDWQPLFHPDLVFTKGYTLLGYAAQGLPADALTDSAVHHLAVIQGRDGQWHNNLPRPPIQTGDIGATALAVHALQRYPLPGRRMEFAGRVERARRWLLRSAPQNTDSRAFQLLGLAWAGESPARFRDQSRALTLEQRADGGWSQLPGLSSDAYATGQALYALQVAAGLSDSDPVIQRGRRFLLETQHEDGSWHVRRRAFPFQPTMPSGFPHSRDSWISAAGTSWAVMALSLNPRPTSTVAQGN